jgi:transposase-like protein
MTKGERISYWQKLVKEQVQSSLSVTDFCRDHQINSQRFYLWRQRFNSQSPASGRGAFLELVPSSKDGGSGIRLRVNPELSIELDCGFDPVTLRQVISVVKASCLP